MSDHSKITIRNTAAEIKAAWEAERQQTNSVEAISAAAQEWAQHSGYQDNPYDAQEIARFVRGDVTPESLQRAADERLAWDPRIPLWKLRQIINGE